MAETIAFLGQRGIPVMAPRRPDAAVDQCARRVQGAGRDGATGRPIEADATAVAEAGAFAVVLEAMAEPLAARDHPRSRSRPSASAPARPATARSWCWKTCSASRRGCRNSSSATRNLARRSNRRSAPMRPRCAAGPFRPRPTFTIWPNPGGLSPGSPKRDDFVISLQVILLEHDLSKTGVPLGICPAGFALRLPYR